ncbi:hypothetical protein BJ741DRAFT_626832 [Chytriomyces cf. hyalinus JEL632]|nr:hypothetical protein BJ741DRAFT_626832 [Chytriomyces cf. hyalinus JEL632]
MTESRLSVSDVRASTDSTNYPRIPRPASKMSDRGSKLFSWLMTKKTKIGVMPMHNDTKNASAAPQFGNHQKHFIPPSSPLPSEPVTSTITILESEPTKETTLKKPQHQKPESRVLEYFAKRAGGGNQTDVSVQHSREQISQIVNGVALNSKDQQQQTLVLKDCRQLLNSDVLALAHALASNTHLTELDLSNTRTSTAAAIELAKALEKNCTLRVLNLERNLIGPQGMQALAASLAVNKTLNVLKLDGQYLDMDMDTEAVLASAVLKNSSLTGITVSLRDASARKQLFYAIQSNRSQVAP